MFQGSMDWPEKSRAAEQQPELVARVAPAQRGLALIAPLEAPERPRSAMRKGF